MQARSFEDIYKDLFIQFLAAVPPWFTLDINQGVLTIHLGKSSPSAFAAEIYGVALGEDVRDDFKYNFGQHLLQAVLESLRCKAHGRQDIEVRMCRPSHALHACAAACARGRASRGALQRLPHVCMHACMNVRACRRTSSARARSRSTRTRT
jgi:hypothetical protein